MTPAAILMKMQELDLALDRDEQTLRELPALKELARKRAAYQKLKSEEARLLGVRKDLEAEIEDLVAEQKATEDEVTITLRPSEATGDAVILSPDGEDSPFGEYLIVDYYTPTGYNAGTIGQQTMNAPGIRVLKVDSRLAREQNGHWYTFDGTPDFTDGAAYEYAYTNSGQNSFYDDGITANFPLVTNLSANADNRHMTGESLFVSDYLFQQGEGFGAGDVSLANEIFYGDFAFDGNGDPETAPTLGITFTVDSLTAESATITLRRSN